MKAVKQSVFVLAIALCGGCASLEGIREEYLVCPYDAVWTAAVDAMKDRPIQVKEKDKGQIETGWVEMAGTGRTYGIFAREGFGDKQRARMTLTLKRENDVTVVSVSEYREEWHRKGGATQQATKWWPVEPSQEAIAAVVNRLNSHLKEQGCSPA